ncbi:MAG: hypothetical protein GX889_00015 [Clostridiales bacterium]|nr:hypothetical protein [Clostridiales bacterium]
MNKFNSLGMEVLAYKEELMKEQPEIIYKSLNFSIDSMLENKLIDLDVHYNLKEKSISIPTLKELLMNKTSFLKTYEELLIEFEEIRKNLDRELGLIEDCQTISVVEKDKIILNQDFLITEDFIREYFLIESDTDYENLMGRKKFLHKFALLRLEKIMKDFLEECPENKDFEINYSPVFFSESKNLYGIQLVYNIDVELLEDENKLNEISKNLKLVTRQAREYFNKKMVA